MKINTFLIGVQKAGTSTFWKWLSQHPDIFAPQTMKDFHFFTRQEWRDKGIPYLHSFYKGYNKEKIILHGGVNYYFEPEFLDHLLKYQTEGKFLIVLRDPIQRAWSAFRYFKKLSQENRTFQEAIDDELQNRIDPQYRHRYAYLEHGLYAKYLRIIISRIHPSQILIIDFKSLFEHPDEKMKEVFEFLNIEPFVKVDYNSKINSSGDARFQWLNDILLTDKGISGVIKKYFPVQRLLPLSWKIHLGNFMREVNSKPNHQKQHLPIDQLMFLSEFYSQDQKQLSQLIKENWNIEMKE